MAIPGFRAVSTISYEKNPNIKIQIFLFKYLPMRDDKENNIFFRVSPDNAQITDQRKENKVKNWKEWKIKSKVKQEEKQNAHTFYQVFIGFVKQMSTIAHCCSWESELEMEMEMEMDMESGSKLKSKFFAKLSDKPPYTIWGINLYLYKVLGSTFGIGYSFWDFTTCGIVGWLFMISSSWNGSIFWSVLQHLFYLQCAAHERTSRLQVPTTSQAQDSQQVASAGRWCWWRWCR